MKTNLTIGLVILLGLNQALAQEAPKPSQPDSPPPVTAPVEAKETPEQIVARLTDLGEGVHEIKMENGRLKSLKVVGQERISTVLGASKGQITAQKRATLKANAAFVEWMKNHVSSIQRSTDETIVTLQGDGTNLSEQGKAEETHKQVIETQAQGLVRGLTLVGKDTDPETQLLTLVFAWSPQKADLAKEASGINNAPVAQPPSSPTPSQTPSGKPDTMIKKKTTASPGFDD